MHISRFSALALAGTLVSAGKGPFLEKVNNSTWVIGNDQWNVTQGSLYATKLFWEGVPGVDLVGSAAGHYVGYDGENNLRFTDATIASRGTNYIDVSFSAAAGDFHWVIFDDLTGAYQYFVNRALPDISILRNLWRLSPEVFLNGRTHLKDEPLPDFSLYASGTNVQDETWQLADGSFITKYDWSNAVRDRDFYGVYGPNKAGSWFIHPTTEYYNSDHLSQTLTVHRESKTGDAVQLNVVQDTSHFRVGQTVPQPAGKVWGPWLWYLNNGDVADAAQRHKEEVKHVPYKWFKDPAYHSRGGVEGTLTLSDGRPASGAAVFLGDTDTTIRPSIQGKNYYYTTYTNDKGRFSFDNVRSGSYAVYAWSNGGKLADVYTNFTAPVTITKDKTINLGQLSWSVPKGSKRIFQVGEFDKKANGFKNGGVPYQHGVAAQSPANLTFTVGKSQNSDWYFAQSAIGKWTIDFDLSAAELAANKTALLSVSLAGYSQSSALDVDVNGQVYASLSKDTLTSDPALYRSGKISGEWRFSQYKIDTDVLKAGQNSVGFTVTRYTQWRGFLWDSIILEWI
ncbi:Rhamnogalacturonate lyase 2 [Colletotrichum chlorophyti]|uniref:rhamnogalacturonan endolyase n=1 Tax=Colletotrichum chlorophyti TaxID=708187 RepID=A0A1Q8S920_9PEZI|nr:Rhamnogalacturonate lyase 2 [Colletotrichum chlorophyti]